MKKKQSSLLPVIVIPLGGLFMLALTFFGYLLVYLAIESIFFSNDPQQMNTGLVRRGFMAFIVIAYLLLEQTKWPKLVKATIMVGPYAMVLVTIILQFYENMGIALLFVSIFVALSFLVFSKMRKSWFYYYASLIAILAGMFYGWPRP